MTLRFNKKIIVALTGLLLFASHMYATYNPTATRIEVRIDDQVFGGFDQIEGLTYVQSSNSQKQFRKIVLKRNFVEQSSLSLWARDYASQQEKTNKKVEISRIAKNGEQVSNFSLELAKPLSWTIEKSETAMGGYSEVVELSVR